MVSVNGSVSSGYEGVKDAFAANFNDDFEVGASLAVMHKGEMVVDIWAGHREMERTTEWESDTIINV